MDTVGLVTDGEFNSLRTKGETRPVSILEVRSRVRNQVGSFSHRQLKNMLTISGIIDLSMLIHIVACMIYT